MKLALFLIASKL